MYNNHEFYGNQSTMISVTEIVKEGILEISFSEMVETIKTYQIKNNKEEVVMTGKITGNTQRSCLYIGQLASGKYQFILNEFSPVSFTVAE
jgi:hypothetical protein